jgi:hypothetical protein
MQLLCPVNFPVIVRSLIDRDMVLCGAGDAMDTGTKAAAVAGIVTGDQQRWVMQQVLAGRDAYVAGSDQTVTN